MRAPAPDRAPAAEGPTVTIQRRYADQGGDLLPREHPSLGEFQHQRPGTYGPNARDTLEPIIVFPPERAGPEHGLDSVVQRGQALVEPRDMGLNVRLEAPARPREAVLLRS